MYRETRLKQHFSQTLLNSASDLLIVLRDLVRVINTKYMYISHRVGCAAISELCRMRLVMSWNRGLVSLSRTWHSWGFPSWVPHVCSAGYSATASQTIELRIKSSRSTHIASFEVKQWSIKSAITYVRYASITRHFAPITRSWKMYGNAASKSKILFRIDGIFLFLRVYVTELVKDYTLFFTIFLLLYQQ